MSYGKYPWSSVGLLHFKIYNIDKQSTPIQISWKIVLLDPKSRTTSDDKQH